MAAIKPSKSWLYQSLYNLNQAFETVAQEINHLRDSKTITPNFVALYHNTAEELRAAINRRVGVLLFAREEKEWAHFGKLRIKQEKQLAQK